MPLDETQRRDALNRLVFNMFVEAKATANMNTVEVRQLVDDVDDWAELNQTALNQAIRPAIRAKATVAQKSLALAIVAMKRGGLF